MKYKVMSDSANQFNNIEIDYVIEDFTIGRDLMFLGENFKLQQNGKILVLANKDRVITIQDVTPEPKVKKPKLVFNETLDIFFETSEISVGADCTYKELYDTLKLEWPMVNKISLRVFPLEYDETLKLLTFKNDWKLSNGSLKHLSEGSFSCLNKAGRYV